MPKEEECATCKFWYGSGDPKENINECRANAPYGKETAHWPLTKARDWCGQYKENKNA